MDNMLKKVGVVFSKYKFVGNYDFNDDDYLELLKEAKHICNNFCLRVGSYIRPIYYKLIFITLVEIAKRWKDEENRQDINEENGLWSYIYNSLQIDEYDTARLYSELTNIILALGNLKLIPIVQRGQRYYATIMMHAFAPQSSIYAFFELCYNVYKKDLDFGFTDEDYDICAIVAKNTRDILSKNFSEKRSVSIGSSAYAIKIGLRSFALHEELKDEFLKLYQDTFNSINNLYYGKNILNDSRLSSLIIKWWKTKQNESQVDKLYKKSTRMTAVTKQNINVKYVRDNQNVYLCVPPIRIENIETSLWLSIYVGDENKLFYSSQMRTRRGEFIATTTQEEFNLNELLKRQKKIKVKVEIMEDGKVIYDSDKNKTFCLNREFILFDASIEIRNKIISATNYFVYTPDIDSLAHPVYLSTYSNNLYNIYAQPNEVLAGIVDKVYFVTGKGNTATNTPIMAGKIGDIEWENKSFKYEVFNNTVKIFIPENINIKALELQIDSCKQLFTTLNIEAADNGYYLFDITSLIQKLKPMRLAVYSYEKEKELISKNIILLSNISLKYDKQFYYGEMERKLYLAYEDFKKVLSWDKKDTEIIYPFKGGNLVIKTPYLKWKIDEKEWLNKPLHKAIWYKNYFDSSSLLDVSSSADLTNATLFAFINGQSYVVERNKLNAKFEVGKFIFSQENNREILFLLQANKEVKSIELFKTATKEYFQSCPLKINENRNISFNKSIFIGKNNRNFKIEFSSTSKKQTVIDSNELINDEITNLANDIYWVKVISEDGGLFTKKEKVFWQGEFVFGDREKIKLSKIIFKISPIIGITSDSWKVVKSGYYVSSFKRLNNLEDTYICELFELDGFGNKNSINGVSSCHITVTSDEALRILIKDENDKFTKKLMYDNGNKKLTNLDEKRFFNITNYNFIEVENV